VNTGRLIPAIAVVGVAFVLYAPTIHDYFLQDDFGVVSLLSQKPATFFPRWFVMPWTENIWGYVPDEVRPFPAVSYQMAAVFGASTPAPNHVMNIALHAINGLLVLAIAREAAGLALAPATVAALAFTVLPIQAESVAWVTGRVDSLPACFYFASFLLFVRWRSNGRRGVYLWSVTLFFAALFSKQNTITMVPALMLYDVLPGRRHVEATWAWLRPYVPFIALTLGFFLLRYVLFHEVARESTLNAERVRLFLSDSSRHMVRLVFGGDGMRAWTTRDTLVVALGAIGLTMGIVRAATSEARWLWRPAVYFAVVWIALGVAPILMSGYYSPRHMYLASLGWAVALGIAFDILRGLRPTRAARLVSVIAAAGVLVVYAGQSRDVVRDWNRRAALSRQALDDLERETMRAREGTLVVVGVPAASWAFAAPHAFRPPFAASDLTRRVRIVTDSTLHCCAAPLWNEYTRTALQTWQQDPSRPPVVAMYWDPRTSRLSRVSDEDDPQLRTLIGLLAATDSRETLDSGIRGLLVNFVALR